MPGLPELLIGIVCLVFFGIIYLVSWLLKPGERYQTKERK